MYADMCGMMGAFQPGDYDARIRYRNRFVWVLTVVPVLLFLLFQSPVKMVIAGGVAQSVMLPVIAIGALFLRHRRLPVEIAPSRTTTLFLWFAAAVICCLMAYYTVLTITAA